MGRFAIICLYVWCGAWSFALGACEETPSAMDSLLAERARNIASTKAAPAPETVKEQAPSSPIEARHKRGDAVHAAPMLRKAKLAHLAPGKPDWERPASLSFRTIRSNFDYFQVHESFLPEGLPKLHGAAVALSGAVMPIDAPPADGALTRFWIANPRVVSAGCVFCNPPTLGDLVYVDTQDKPVKVDREELYRGVVTLHLLGRFFIEEKKTKDGLDYLFRLELKEVME